MTTLAIIADVHGNLPALDAIIESVGGEADAWLCAGDIAGHLPMVDEVIIRLRDLKALCVLGDHDDALLHNSSKVDSLAASWVLRQQQEYVNEESKAFLAALPERLELEFDGVSILMLHGGTADPLRQRIETVDEDLLGSFEQHVLVVGHRHRPLVHVSNKKAVLCPGAVGLPVDGEKRARVMLVDLPSLHVRVREIPYEPAPLFKRMHQLDYDERYFNCLKEGWWVGFSNPQKRVPVVIVGAGIYGQIISEIIEATIDKYVAGFVDDTPNLQERMVFGHPVLGKVADLDRVAREIGVTEIVVAIGDNVSREKIANRVKSLGLRLATIVHPQASVSSGAKLSPGVVVDAPSSIGPNCVLEEGVTVWPSVSVGHDTVIGKYASIKPGVVIGGGSTIEAGIKVPLGSRWASYSQVTADLVASHTLLTETKN